MSFQYVLKNSFDSIKIHLERTKRFKSRYKWPQIFQMFILVHTAYSMPHIIYNIKRLTSQEIIHACLSNMSKCVSYDAKCQFKNNSEFVVGPGTVRDKLIRIQPKYKQMVLTYLKRLSLLSFSIFSKHSKHKYHKFVS